MLAQTESSVLGMKLCRGKVIAINEDEEIILEKRFRANVNAAKKFLRRATKKQRVPTKITLDAYAAFQRAVASLRNAANCPNQSCFGAASI